MALEQAIVNDGGGRKIGKRGREIGENHRCNGESRRKIGGVRRSVGDSPVSSGDDGFSIAEPSGKMGQAEALWGRTVMLWGRCFVYWGSRPVWGKKFLRSGREPFARWLSIRLPTVPRMLMKFGQKFSKNDGGRQAAFLIFPATLFSSP